MASMSSSRKTQKTDKRLGNSLAELQDQRLTSRHIAALMKLDDTLLENEKLKSRVEFLEKETGSCLEIHEFARESKQKLEQTEKQYHNQIENLASMYDAKILDIQSKQKITEVENVKLQDENKELFKQILDLKKLLFDNNMKLQHLKNTDTIISNLEVSKRQLNHELEGNRIELEIALKKAKDLNDQIKELQEANQILMSQNELLSEENQKLKENVMFESSLESTDKKKLQKEIFGEMEEEEKLEDSTRLPQGTSDKDHQINDLQRKLSLYELERQAIIQSSSDMEIEIEHLKKRLSGLNVSESVTKLRQTDSALDSKKRSFTSLKYTQKLS